MPVDVVWGVCRGGDASVCDMVCTCCVFVGVGWVWGVQVPKGVGGIGWCRSMLRCEMYGGGG